MHAAGDLGFANAGAMQFPDFRSVYSRGCRSDPLKAMPYGRLNTTSEVFSRPGNCHSILLSELCLSQPLWGFQLNVLVLPEVW